MRTAAQEARKLNRECIDTEHILLAILGEDCSLAASVLRALQCEPARIVMEVERVAPRGEQRPDPKDPPLAKGAETTLEAAATEAGALGHDYLGTEHLLLGLLRDEHGLAARVLTSLGLATEDVRREVLRIGAGGASQAGTAHLPDQEMDALGAAGREFALAIYRSAVDFYQPRIEKRTGIQLGGIGVWNYSCLHQHVLDEYRQRTGSWLVGILRVLVFRRRLRRLAGRLREQYAQDARRHAACYYRSGIYVSLDSGIPHDELVALAVVHELSHALWEKIDGEALHTRLSEVERRGAKEAATYRLFIEGFATYAERVWFLDLYPAAVREVLRDCALEPDGVYARGLQHIQALVERHGPKILFELPKRWRSL